MQIKLLSCLTKEERRLVKGLSVKGGYSVIQKSDAFQMLGIVVSGKLEVYCKDLDGNKQVIHTLSEGDIFSREILVPNDINNTCEVVTKTISKIALIKNEDLLNILQNNKEFLIEYLSKKSELEIDHYRKLFILNFESSEDRLISILQFHNDKMEIKSISNTAKELCLTREALSRCISRLEKKHLIKRDGKKIELIRK